MESMILSEKIESLEKEILELKAIRDNIEYETRNPCKEKRWYNLDIGKHFIVSQGLMYQSELFCVESNNYKYFTSYYEDTFGIQYQYEQEIVKRLSNIPHGKFSILDLNVKEYLISNRDALSGEYLYKNLKYSIVSNNALLFESICIMLRIYSEYTNRNKFDWFNTEIKQYLDFNPPVINTNRVVSHDIMNIKIYYSEFHRLWGFNYSEFKLIYSLEVGHTIDQEELLLKRLNKHKRGLYTNLDPNISKLDQLSKEFIFKRFKFIDHSLKIVANSRVIFESYRKALSHSD